LVLATSCNFLSKEKFKGVWFLHATPLVQFSQNRK
jgi:hypothetical protein